METASALRGVVSGKPQGEEAAKPLLTFFEPVGGASITSGLCSVGPPSTLRITHALNEALRNDYFLGRWRLGVSNSTWAGIWLWMSSRLGPADWSQLNCGAQYPRSSALAVA